ncbi:hypothetical protein J2Z32_000451 [Paenibacillus turicensis]|uniref:DUF4179 domain-containing protein n=1 Tax=Paenibacillus turicensis TaxID=160487 RepID=A0ABS4FN94_9BACL|nr:DUF4179 domain-containing protein [Paenibacillus turicensis]MBP1903839.1 hypothetical protein [Paenibacillus turicensis]
MTDEHNPYELLETRLLTRKTEYDTISVPSISTSLAVHTGIKQATRKHKIRMRWVMSSISVAVFVLIFTGYIRISPTFAGFVKQFPGMEGIVNIIIPDKGVMTAMNHALTQKVGITDEHDGISLTVEGIVTDKSRMVIFYKIKGLKDAPKSSYSIDLLDENGKILPVGFIRSLPNSVIEGQVFSDVLDAKFPSDIDPPDKLTVVLTPEDKTLSAQWKVTTPIDKNLTKGMEKNININETLTLDGQNIHIKQATIYPTHLVLDVQFDPRNTKEIFGLSELQLIDEQGHIWRTNSPSGEGTRSIHFESMYFSMPKKLTLKGSGFSGMDRSELDFRLNLNSKELIGAPNGLKFVTSTVDGKDLILQLDILDDMKNSYIPYFTEVKDSADHSYEVISSRMDHAESTDKNYPRMSYTIENGAALKDEIKIQLSSYPMKVHAPFSVEIPIH